MIFGKYPYFKKPCGLYTERSEVSDTKFLTRSEATFITRSLLHGAKRSFLYEVFYTQFPTRSSLLRAYALIILIFAVRFERFFHNS